MSDNLWPCEKCGVLTDEGGMCGPCWEASHLAALEVGRNVVLSIPKRPPRRAGESEIVRRIREAVGAIGGVTLWRNNTGMLEDRNGTKVRFGLCEGSADLVGIVEMCPGRPVGRFIAIEVKQPGKKPRADQQAFLDLVTSLGGYACWVTSVDDAVAHVEKARCL